MPVVPISLGTKSNPGRTGAAGQARLINCYAENAGNEGVAQYPIYATDGWNTAFADATSISGTVSIRAMLSFSSTAAYIVSGTKVFKIDTSGTVTAIAGASGTFTVTSASPAVFTSAAHGLAAGAKWVPTTSGALYTGLTAGATYYIKSTGLTANTFQISATAGTNGTAVNTSGSQSGTHSWSTTSVVSSSGLVTMARNRAATAQIGIVTSDGNYYVIANDKLVDYGGVIAELATGTALSIAFHDGYFIVAFDNAEFFASGIDDATTIDVLAFATAESSPDGLVRNIKRGDSHVLLGERSTEFWKDTGATDFAFERSTVADFGCYAAGSVTNILSLDGATTDTIAFCATNTEGAFAGVVILNGYSATRISPPGLERAIRDGGAASTIRGFSRAEGGRVFYCLTDLSTYFWALDMSTQLWHEETSSGLAFRRMACAMSFAGYTIIGDYALPKLYKVLPNLYDASNASVVTVKHSNDNGNTWVTCATQTITGATDLKQRFKFNRLGQSKEDGKVFQIIVSVATMEAGVANSMTIEPPTVTAWPSPVRFWSLNVDVIPGSSLTSTPKGVTRLAADFDQLQG